MENIFRSLCPKQVRINSLEEEKFFEKTYKYLELFENKYSNNLFFILFLVLNKSNLIITPEEQVTNFEIFINNLLEKVNKENLFYKFNYNKNSLIKKGKLVSKLLNKNLDGYDLIKLFSDYFKINIFIITMEYKFNFINDINSNNYLFELKDSYYRLMYINKNIYNLNTDQLNLNKNIEVDEELIHNYKNYKIAEIKKICDKLKINLYKEDKLKNKSILLLDIGKVINYI